MGSRWWGWNSGVEGVGQYFPGRPSPLDVLMHVENNLTANLLHSFSFLPRLFLCPPSSSRRLRAGSRSRATSHPFPRAGQRRTYGGPFLLYPRAEWLRLFFLARLSAALRALFPPAAPFSRRLAGSLARLPLSSFSGSLGWA